MKQLYNLRSYFTFLSRNKIYTAINLFGLSASFAFVILIGLYYQRETSIDKNVDGGDRVYNLSFTADGQSISGTSREIIPLLRKQLPQIETACALFRDNEWHVQYAESDKMKADVLFADSTFHSVFQQPLAEGNPQSALDDPNSVLLSRTMARRLFPDGQAMGKTIVMNDQFRLHVTGVYERMEGTSLPNCDLIVRYELLRPLRPYFFDIQGNFGSPDVFLKLKPSTNATALDASINRILFKIYRDFWPDAQMKGFHLVPLADTYFSNYHSGVCQRGKPRVVYIVFIVGLLILAFSIMNYINLTTAQAGYRSHEMAMRRLLGSQQHHILLRLIMESVWLCLVAVLLAIGLAWLAAPYASHLLDTDIRLAALFRPLNLLLLLGITLTVGVLAGALPAAILSRISPINIVRGTFRRQTKMVFSKVFIVIQNVITITFLAIALIVNRQVHHLVQAPLGYDTRGVMEISIPQDAQKAAVFKRSLLQLSCVSRASICMGSPFTGGFNQTVTVGKRSVRCQRFYGDQDYLALLGIRIERQFTQQDSAMTYVSPNFHTLMGLPADARKFSYNENYHAEPIHGILADFKLFTIAQQADNEVTVAYVMKKPFDQMCLTMLIKAQGDEAEAYKQVQEIYYRVYQEALTQEQPYLNQQIREAFKDVRRMATLMTFFAFIAIVISLLGLVAMSTYFIQQRNKEIAVRKVFGSTSNQIRQRLIRTFLNYVLVAFVISAPIAWYITSQWITRYNYRIVWWPYILLAGLLVLLISGLAVIIQSWMASNENPVNHLKQE